VFYPALEEETCEAEVKYHIKDGVTASGFARFYHLLACDFVGTVANLLGKEVGHPELISPTEDGYPFCQALAKEARAAGVHAFHTPSARYPGGTCSPVFDRPNLANEQTVARTRFVPTSSGLTYERIT
jgi:hypothetical protein